MRRLVWPRHGKPRATRPAQPPATQGIRKTPKTGIWRKETAAGHLPRPALLTGPFSITLPDFAGFPYRFCASRQLRTIDLPAI